MKIGLLLLLSGSLFAQTPVIGIGGGSNPFTGLTTNAIPKVATGGAGANSSMSDNGTTITSTEPITAPTFISGSGPTTTGNGLVALVPSTGQTCTTSNCVMLRADSNANRLYLNVNNTDIGPVGGSTPIARIIPFGAAPAGTAASGVSYATGQWTPTARAGSNNLGAGLQAIPSTGATLQFLVELPADWDTATTPYIRIVYGSGANTSGTVIWTISTACSKSDGSVSDDPAFHAESAFATQTMATANRMWAQTGQLVAVTSGNNCIAGSPMIVRAVLSGTASAAINAYEAVLTIPEILNNGAN